MERLSNEKGFTLIEIIVVLIIVGILSAIALPNLFSNIRKSRGAEATVTIGSFRSTVEACMMKNPAATGTNCTSAVLGAPEATTVFSYVLTVAAGATTDGSYTIIANGTANGLVSGTDYIVVSRAAGNVTAGGGIVTCAGYGQLMGAC